MILVTGKDLRWLPPLWRGDGDSIGETVKYYSFEIVIEKEPEDEGYFAYSPTLPGCFSNGRRVDEAKQGIREAIHQHLDLLREKG